MNRVRDYLIPAAAETDDQFRQELLESSRRGLVMLGAVEAALALLLFAAGIRIGAETALILSGLGAVTVLMHRAALGWTRVRMTGFFSALIAGALLGWAGEVPGIVILGLLFPVAMPVEPWEALALGAEMAAIQFIHGNWVHPLFVPLIALAMTLLAAELYARRRAIFRDRQQAIRVAEALAGAQLRAQLAETAAGIGKLAAAVTHEINSPLGTLKSSIDTMLVVATRQCTAPDDQQAQLLQMQAELRRSVEASSARIEEVVARLQRFIHLEEAEIKDADVNELLKDAVLRLDPQVRDRVQLELNLQALPALNCRPQLLSVAFSDFLGNAIDAVNGDGRIRISTQRVGRSEVEVRFEDNGRGMPPEVVEGVFDPSFKISGDRVRSGNWSLFNSRQIVYEHGGDIRIASTVGKGTSIIIILPCKSCAMSGSGPG
ncbi:MAG: ATP-binding protein [Bryobacteraceae bacterium]